MSPKNKYWSVDHYDESHFFDNFEQAEFFKLQWDYESVKYSLIANVNTVGFDEPIEELMPDEVFQLWWNFHCLYIWAYIKEALDLVEFHTYKKLCSLNEYNVRQLYYCFSSDDVCLSEFKRIRELKSFK